MFLTPGEAINDLCNRKLWAGGGGATSEKKTFAVIPNPLGKVD